MKYLKIENNKGHFIKDKNLPEIWTEIDLIEKDDLLKLLDYATEENDFSYDEYDNDKLSNKAHNIIYKHIVEKFESFLQNKNRFKDEVDNLYREAIEKYSN
ncbi:hypothetical protein [Capnocytophaga stomatis]|uniref:Uncharacterized protein n=1 Tax=Capnocytophaga stomatis TaxID=1848904 RepID=A0ABW8Q753_9FLAO